MSDLQKLYAKYRDIEWDDLTTKMDEELKQKLANIPGSDINSTEDAQAFLVTLWKFRKHVENSMKLFGDNFKDMLQSLLGVGADGLYQNKLRFLFELIQNVDDCDYEDSNNCNLDIFFDFNKDEIVLSYNEKGFTPFNVFAITGIAEAAKNISMDKVEIGEKGIGFKSVFGIAKKVLIQSGYFSFVLDKNNFTLPQLAYENFDFIPGTKMTIFLSQGDVNKIYNSISNSYVADEAIFEKNPVLFLNKLTHLRMYNDSSWRNMSFDISREPIDYSGGFHAEHNVKLSVNLGNADTGVKVKKEIICNRYTLPVLYDEATCKSRYGEKSKLTGKKMHVQILMPIGEHVKQLKSGSLYSFLPTQIKLTIPAVLHAPFKLDASREFVDDQNQNKWYTCTCANIGKLLDGMYKDMAESVKEDIVYYIPPKGTSIIDNSFGKTKLLASSKVFSGMEYLKLPLFHTVSGQFFPVNKVISFPTGLDASICSVFDNSKNWFIPPMGFSTQSLQKVGLQIEQNIANYIFSCALQDENNSEQCFKYLSENELVDKVSFESLKPVNLTVRQVEIILNNKTLLDKINMVSGNAVKNSKIPKFTLIGIKSENVDQYLQEDINDVPPSVGRYFKTVGQRCVVLDNIADSFLILSNTVVLSRGNEVDSFINLCDCIDPGNMFVNLMKASKFSRELDKLDKADITTTEYMQQLRMARNNLKKTLGPRQYKNYIDILLNCGSDSSRFINELLQNADDCNYADGVVPSFSLKLDKNKIVTDSNEIGFGRANVRAITAIGESTKELLFSRNSTIGYKGVGFKMVFAVARNVAIHSGEYHFHLTDDNPIVPQELVSVENNKGTKMIFDLRNPLDTSSFTVDKVIRLCLCLRKLQKLSVLNYDIEIIDDEKLRKIIVNDKQYLFKKSEHLFEMSEEVFQEESSQSQTGDRKQSILCYAAYDKDSKEIMKEGRIYCGLPTEIKLNVPLSVDGPFKLTTSRDDLIQCKWNDETIREVYIAIVELLNTVKEELRVNTLEYIKFREVNKGSYRDYLLEMFDGSTQKDKLNSAEFENLLKEATILPTKDASIFVSAKSKAKKYPNVVELLLQAGMNIETKDTVLDVGQRTHVVTLNGLGVVTASFEDVYSIVKNHINEFISDLKFRTSFYSWLENTKLTHEQKEILGKHNVVPVYENNRNRNNTVYVPAEKGKICTCEQNVELPSSYKVLNETLLSKKDCVGFFGISPTEADKDIVPALYRNELTKGINARLKNKNELYQYVLAEFKSGKIKDYKAIGDIQEIWSSGELWLKNTKNRITPNAKFISHQVKDYFFSDIINEMIIHDECVSLSRALKVRELSTMLYQDISDEVKHQLSEDDVDDFICGDFVYSKNIIDGFIEDGMIAEALIKDKGLIPEGGDYETDVDNPIQYTFPEDNVVNKYQAINHIRDIYNRAGKIISVEERRTVQKVRYPDGKISDLGTGEARQQTMFRYNPDGRKEVCYCQMCERVKLYRNIEVNSIIKTPVKFLPSLRLALCLECSKLFELYRNDDVFYEEFIANLKNAKVNGGSIKVDVADKGKTIKFTSTHLLEIQELLKLLE